MPKVYSLEDPHPHSPLGRLRAEAARAGQEHEQAYVPIRAIDARVEALQVQLRELQHAANQTDDVDPLREATMLGLQRKIGELQAQSREAAAGLVGTQQAAAGAQGAVGEALERLGRIDQRRALIEAERQRAMASFAERLRGVEGELRSMYDDPDVVMRDYPPNFAT